MRKTGLIMKRLRVLKKGKTEYLLLCLLCIVIAALLTTCGGAGSTPGSFTLVSGSGTVSVYLSGANTLDFSGKTFYFGTVSTGTPIGGEATINSDNMILTLQDGGPIVFTGGLELEVGGFIDVNGNGSLFHMADNGDYVAGTTVTVSGNETVSLAYPDNFSAVSNSGTVSVTLLGANDDWGTKTFYFGTISTGTAIGGEETITSNEMSMDLPNSEVPITFTGGMELEVGGFIDVDGDAATSGTYAPDDGDYVAGTTVTVTGDSGCTLTYPGDFTVVSGSGIVSVNLKNALSSHSGKEYFYGTTSTGTPIGGQQTINSDSMLMTLNNGGPDYVFAGGTDLTVGGFIDVNGNGADFGMPDDGDYVASQPVTVAGDTVVTFTYE